MENFHNLYFHVPFCSSKCRYCAFYSNAEFSPDWDKYVNGILSEINFWHEKLGKIDVPTIFWGGGTPSLMPIQIFEKIMNSVRENFNLLPDCEITLESNPGTLDKNKLSEFQKLGINRLSVGVQSLNDNDLEFLGRKHNVQQAIDLINAAKELGLNVSADFMYGLPNQNETDVKKLCEQINELNLNHVSMYELTIESNTPFGKMNLKMPDNETMAKMYETISDTLNLPRYEISNYANAGFECKHNLNIWDGDPYIGIGRGAAGRPLITGKWFEQTGGDIKLNLIDNKTRNIEKIITGMRTIRGVELNDEIKNLIDWEFVKNNADLIQINNERISATKKGLLILDNLLLNLIK